MKVIKRLTISMLIALLAISMTACGGTTSNMSRSKFTTVYYYHPISPGAPKNPYNATGNSFTSFDKMQLAWSANSATDLNKFYPGLAEKWSANSDGTTATVEIQPKAKWSNGKPVTANDVKTSMAIAFTQGTAQSFSLGSVKVLSQKKVELSQLPGAKYNMFLHDLLQQTVIPDFQYGKLLPKNIWALIDQSLYSGKDKVKAAQAKKAQEQITKLGKSITTFAPKTDISAGPFVLKRLNPGEAYLVKNKYFYASEKVKVGSVSLRNYTGNQQIWNYLTSGQLDAAPFTAMPQNVLDNIVKTKGNQKVVTPTYVAASLAFDQKFYPYGNVNVRKALAYVIDRKAVQKVAEPVVGKPSKYTDGIVDSVAGKWIDASTRSKMDTYDLNLKKATAMLQKEGFKKTNGKWVMPNGKPWTMDIYVVNGFSDWIQGGKVISSQLTNFGIDAKPTIVSSFAQYQADLAAQKYAVGFWLDSLGASMYTSFGRIYGMPDGYNVVGGKLTYSDQKDKTKGNWVGLPQNLKLSTGEKVNPGKLTYQLNQMKVDEQRPNVQKLALATNEYVPLIEIWDYIHVQFVNNNRFTNFPVKDEGLMNNMPGVWMSMGYVTPKSSK
ncbi:ABC transporter substrate-binding protein [Sporolactobacillus laevolacticus]|uniref:ABC transporter substrate-binding protein n=1 Tax=Sporolactobacillus laevolacticus TaxID=33018 RepID=UPI0025B3B139|nr:ABC transporter substrate-binding protein [Sporolactobacillus laevolacticus]MDN3955773.1 ABC transporter substrate-binding protein [Sporolactobacillus laevolacticus]